MARYGIGATGRGAASLASPPTAPDNGIGGPGVLAGAIPGTVRNIGDEVGEVTAGRITLSALGFVVVGMVAFYVWTRATQGGG